MADHYLRMPYGGGETLSNFYKVFVKLVREVGSEVSSDMMLVDYLRNKLELRGTKYMCREGGCGACCVSVVKCAGGPVVSVNSCLVSIPSCQGWEITTIEEIGNRKKGYHILQNTIAESYGTQCGHCTPGWVQNLYSLLKNGNKPTMLDIEKSVGSNICRCTGYRPIIKALQKFGIDAPKESRIMDIEDLKICEKTSLPCDKSKCEDYGSDWCTFSDEEIRETSVLKIELQDNTFWYKVFDLKSIFEILNEHGYDSYMLVSGNTAKGIYPIEDYPKVLIDIASVSELKRCTFDQNLIVGVGNTLNELRNIFKNGAKQDYFGYLDKFGDHIDWVANIPVKNLGSLGGNLMIKHQHREFPSDLFLIFETVGACLSIYTSKGETKKLSMEEFLKEDMKGKIILDAILPPLGDDIKIETYKIMPRAQSAPAVVNAGYLYKLSADNKVNEARIVYGGLSSSFIRAEATEKFLVGKPLFSNTTLQSALTILESELVIEENPRHTSIEYRKQLSLSLFYKGLISLCPKGMLNSRFMSGTTKIHDTRPTSHGRQDFETNPSLWPLNQPIHKVEALIQAAGESKYTGDLQVQPREVYAAFVLSTVPVGDIVKIDLSEALKIPGVIAVYTAADIPGENSFMPANTPLVEANEEVFASKKVAYFNQPIGLVVATTQHIANRAAKIVTATYTNVKEPVIDIKIAKDDPKRTTLYISKLPTEKGTDVVKTLKGQNTINTQLHITMENISCVTLPTEEGLECHVTTQWMDGCQLEIAKALNMDASKIDIHVRRVGGSFGLKLSRANQIAVACSLVTEKLNRPCRLIVPLSTCARAVGKRMPCHVDYEVEVSATGVIQSVKYRQYEDSGYTITETISLFGSDAFNNCYTDTKWDFEMYNTLTDTAKNTFCRSPGSLEGIALAEFLIERISYELSLDPIDVRIANVDTTKYNDLIGMAEELKTTASYADRKAKVAKFNSENRWKKRGIRCAFTRWTPSAFAILEVNLSICHGDGTVIITHGGIEMGQGINTIATQICAYYFKIPIDKIQIKGNNTIIAPNCFATAASVGSQNVGLGVRRCCEAMLQRLEPIRTQLGNPTWLELILQAHSSDVDLQVHSRVGMADMFNYKIFGVALAEVEVDVLTGESEILRVDILQDVGQSVNPYVNIGQVEGAFIMGQGYWTCEDVVYDKSTGEVLSDSTLNYHVPLARDIPQDFRVAFKTKSYSLEPIMGAKCAGEPPICLSVVVAFALREAIAAARQETGIPTTTWFDIEGAHTIEKVCLASALQKEHFTFT